MRPASGVTFRDPAGSVRFSSSAVHRRILPGNEASTRAFLRTALFEGWVRKSVVTPAREIDDGEALELEHPRLFLISYPWEWCPAQLRAAAELTLDLCADAIGAGYILKDATPLNVLFEAPRPVFVDVLSFEKRDPGSALWLAQGQFVRTFLLPMLALRHLGWPLAAAQLRRDGYEPSQLYESMSWLQRLSPSVFGPVTLPAWLERDPRNSREDPWQTKQVRHKPEIATAVLHRSLSRLRRHIQSAAPPLPPGRWTAYSTAAPHYSAADHAAKQEFVSQVLSLTRAQTVLDLGANTGTYSRMAASAGARVVAIDHDPAVVERLWQTTRETGSNILPMVADIARPTPALGWENAESFSLLERLENKFDLVLLLALIHHLLLIDQVTLQQIAALAARISRRHVLVEWVPSHDPMFQFLLRGRGAIYGHLHLDAMLAAFAPAFLIVARRELANGRTLILFEKRGT